MGTSNFGRGSDHFITYYANSVISFDDYFYNPDNWESIEEFEEQYYEQLEEPGVVTMQDYEEIQDKIDDFNRELEIFKIEIKPGYYDGFQIVTDFIEYDLFDEGITYDDVEMFGFDSVEELNEMLSEEYSKVRAFLKELAKYYDLLK